MLANGVTVLVAKVRRLPLVSVRFLFDAGAAGEPVAQAGLSALTTHALAEGTAHHDGAALADLFERLGASLDLDVSWDGATIASTVLSDRVDAAIELMVEVLRVPSFPPREVERLRAERLAELLEIRSEPRALADEAYDGYLYRAGSRYALPDGGARGTVEGLARADLIRFHQEHFVPSALTVVIAGDCDTAAVLATLERTIGGWSGAAPTLAVGANLPARQERSVHIVRRNGAAQTEVRAGHVGLARSHPDYFSVVVMNAILGGVFNSRLNLNLRERHGYTYGASSAFVWRRDAGPFVVSAAVATDVSAAAVTEILAELERMRLSPPTEKELSLVQSYLEGVFPIRFESTEAIAAAVAALRTFSLPDDYYSTYRERVRAVTADDVLRAARTHLHPDLLQIVAVGDPAVIGATLERLGVGPVTYEAESKTDASATP
jgi:zinc protease